MTDIVRDMTEFDYIASAILQVMTIPSIVPTDFKADAIATFCCMGETRQITEAIYEWERSEAAGRFLIAGPSTKEKTYVDLTMETLGQPPYNLQRTECVVRQESAQNTPDQMNWIVAQAISLGIASFIIFMPAYHATRAYLTLVKAMERYPDNPMAAIPRFTGVPLNAYVPEAETTSRFLVADEMRKIQLYQEKGDVATLRELEAYLDYTLSPILGF